MTPQVPGIRHPCRQPSPRHEGIELGEGQRATEEVALVGIAAFFFEEPALPFGLDALGNHREIQISPERDDGAGNRSVPDVREHVLHNKAPIYFDLIQRQTLQMREGGVACSEAVE